MDSSLKSKKFGVVHTSPTELLNGGKTLELGKLYFAQGEANGAAKQGIYALTNSTDVDGVAELTMFGCGALADANGAGLMSSTDYSKLAGIAENANNYSHPKAGTGTIDTPSTTNTANTLLTRVKIDSSGHVTDTSAFNGTVGGTTTPIYFNAGVPTPLNYTIETSVPSNAVFTDTWRAIKVNGTEKINSTTSTALDISGGTNIDVSYNNSKVVISVKNVDASTADTADKVANSLTIKGGGTTVKTFNGSTATTIEVKTGNSSTLTVTGANDGSITITPVTAAVSTSSNALTTGKQVADYVNTQLGNLSGALIYRGTVDGSSTNLPTTHSAGDVYVASASFTTTTTQTGVAYTVESGDYFISNGTIFNVVNGENQVSNANATLDWNTSTKIATVDGTDIYVKLPANPNSNTWRGVYVDNTSVLGTGTDTSALKFVDGSNIDAYWNSTNKTIQFNHKAPTASDSSKLTKTASSTTSATWGSTDMITGITLMRDVYGHVTDVSISSIQMPSNPNTNKTSKNVVGASSSANTNAAVTTNGSVYLNHLEDSSVTSSHNIVGSGTVSVTSDANGKITINGTDTNTDTKVKDASVTTKSYILGHASQGTTAEAQTNSSCYMSGGHLYSNGKQVLTSATDTKCTSLTLSADTSADVPTALYADVISNTAISASGTTGTSLSGTMTSVRVATQKAVDAAQEAATIYWETL